MNIRLLEAALRVLKANTFGPSREHLCAAAGQAELFNEIEATLEVTEAVGIEPEPKATPLREENPGAGEAGFDLSTKVRRSRRRSAKHETCHFFAMTGYERIFPAGPKSHQRIWSYSA